MGALFLYPGENILPHHGEAFYYSELYDSTEKEILFESLVNGIVWKQEPIKLFGKEVMQPRLTAWYGDPGVSYSYSGITMQPHTWNAELGYVKQRVEELAGITFNSALLNLYRNGNDGMGWHRDNERELGKNPIIASVSFGAERKFQLRTYSKKADLKSICLANGSCLIMRGETQHYWEHRVPKISTETKPRLNITFRKVAQ